MWRYSLVLFIITYCTIVESTCLQPNKFYVDCTTNRALINATQICIRYGMSLVNLTNSSSLINDIGFLNQSLISASCFSNFWFASGNSTGYVGSVTTLGEILTGLLGGTLNLVLGIVGSLLGCILNICPLTTTPIPITQAILVCTRTMQSQVIQKCQTTLPRNDMKVFQFNEQPMYGGVLDSFPLRSRTICSSLCSENTQCIGISYIDGICYLYI